MSHFPGTFSTFTWIFAPKTRQDSVMCIWYYSSIMQPSVHQCSVYGVSVESECTAVGLPVPCRPQQLISGPSVCLCSPAEEDIINMHRNVSPICWITNHAILCPLSVPHKSIWHCHMFILSNEMLKGKHAPHQIWNLPPASWFRCAPFEDVCHAFKSFPRLRDYWAVFRALLHHFVLSLYFRTIFLIKKKNRM